MNENITTNNAAQVVALFDSKKEDRQLFSKSLIIDIKEGKIDALKAHVQIKKMAATLDLLLDKKVGGEIAEEYASLVLEDATKYGKNFELHNCKFETKETGTKYDYSQCNDESILMLNAELEDLKIKIKEREAYLKALPSAGVDVIIDSTGEVVRLCPPSKSSTTSVTVKL